MIRCNEVMDHISLYISQDLDDTMRKTVEEHLDSCPQCREEYNQLMHVIGLCNALPEEELPSSFTQQLHEKLLKEETLQKRQGQLYFIPRKYIGIGATMAAGLVIAFLLRGIAGNMNFYTGTKNQEKAIERSSDVVPWTAAQEPESTAARDQAATDSARQEENSGQKEMSAADAGNGNMGITGSGQPNESQMTEQAPAGEKEDTMTTFNKSAALSVPELESASPAKGIAPEASSDSIVEAPRTTVSEIPEAAALHRMSLQVDSVDNALQEINDIGAQFGVMTSQIQAVQPTSIAAADPAKSAQLVQQEFAAVEYLIKKESLELFDQIFLDKYGFTQVSIFNAASPELNQAIQQIEEQLKTLELTIQDAKSKAAGKNDDEIKTLDSQREYLIKKREALQRKNEYVVVEIIINKK